MEIVINSTPAPSKTPERIVTKICVSGYVRIPTHTQKYLITIRLPLFASPKYTKMRIN